MSITLGFDTTHQFISQLPAGCQAAGYDTGGDGVAWTEADWAAHPGAVHVDQDPDASDATADVLDCENGAVPVGSPLIAAWAKRAQASWNAAARPGQRTPALYCSASNVTANVNALTAGGVTPGTGLWIADWTGTDAQAIAEIIAASGPFPVIGGQFQDLGDIDADVWSTAWLANVSGQVPPAGWVYCPCQGVTAQGGKTSVGASWSAPDGPPGAAGIGCYQVTVRYVTGKLAGQDVATYPRYVPKLPNPQSWQGGSLPSATPLVFKIRARSSQAEPDPHAGNWVTVPFATNR
jgi:hypothetical protein